MGLDPLTQGIFGAIASPIIGGLFGGGGGAQPQQQQQSYAPQIASGVGSYINSAAATNAANAQVEAANRATGVQTGMYERGQQSLQPYAQGGGVALSSLLGKFSDGSLGGQFTPTDYLSNKDPGYEFQLDQGNQALQNSQAAKDGVLSGSALKGLINYNQGAASTGYQNAYNRWLSSQQNSYGQLRDTASLGERAAARALPAPVMVSPIALA